MAVSLAVDFAKKYNQKSNAQHKDMWNKEWEERFNSDYELRGKLKVDEKQKNSF